ncbi:hypothetical protein JCM13210_07630 [Thermaerobacter litoralis]
MDERGAKEGWIQGMGPAREARTVGWRLFSRAARLRMVWRLVLMIHGRFHTPGVLGWCGAGRKHGVRACFGPDARRANARFG